MSKLGYMLEHPENPAVLCPKDAVKIRPVRAISREVFVTPQRPHAEPSFNDEVVIWSALRGDAESQAEQETTWPRVSVFETRGNRLDVRSGALHHLPDPEHRICDGHLVDDGRGLTVAPVGSDLDAQIRLYAGTPGESGGTRRASGSENPSGAGNQQGSLNVDCDMRSLRGHTPNTSNEVMIWSDLRSDAESQAEQETTWPRACKVRGNSDSTPFSNENTTGISSMKEAA